MAQKLFFPFLIFTLLLSNQLFAQYTIISDDHLVLPMETPGERNLSQFRSADIDTLSFGIASPFIDDFSGIRSFPDPAKWVLGDDKRYPIINLFQATAPPSQGVATFDGANASGRPYAQNAFISGKADRLQSHCIDLSGFSVADNLVLSFSLQPQGIGNAPDNSVGNTDFFKVYFATNTDPGSNEANLVMVEEITNSGNNDFTRYAIALNDPAYFHAGFYIRFETTGALYGLLDQWHLDYVYLGANRSLNDLGYNDVSLLTPTNSMLGIYTAIPYDHYPIDGQPLFTPEIVAGNQASTARVVSLTAEISDPTFNNPFGPVDRSRGDTQLSGLTQGPVDLADDFSLQAFGLPGAYRLKIELDKNDLLPENNVVEQTYRIDSIMAYDDGEADASFGLNNTRGFGVEFQLDRPDTLEAAWINFVPTVSCGNGDCSRAKFMENEAFRLTIWDHPNPDSTRWRQIAGMRVRYGESLNHFERYELSEPIPVSGTFYLGIQQLTQAPIGVGLDLNFNNESRMYWDSLGNWVNANVNGTFMIRPEFQTPPGIVSNIETEFSQKLIKSYPNPLKGTQLNTELGQAVSAYELQLFDSKGQKIWQEQRKSLTAGPTFWQLPHIPAGMYILRHELRLNDGSYRVEHEKLLINP